jgi:hypothetical protein
MFIPLEVAASRAGMSRRGFQFHVTALIKGGELVRLRHYTQGERGKYYFNEYWLDGWITGRTQAKTAAVSSRRRKRKDAGGDRSGGDLLGGATGGTGA